MSKQAYIINLYEPKIINTIKEVNIKFLNENIKQ